MYIFETTEQNNAKANDFETKSLLYLMSFKSDSTDIDSFFVDCFNDITGVSNDLLKLWDVQSKNVASLTPRTIGRHLITLFQNFISPLEFYEYILFIPKLKEDYLNDITLTEFKIDNFKDIVKMVRKGKKRIIHCNDCHYDVKYNSFMDDFNIKCIHCGNNQLEVWDEKHCPKCGEKMVWGGDWGRNILEAFWD